MKRRVLIIFFWLVICLMAVSLLLTIIGSTENWDTVLYIGIIAWLATTCMFFAWLVLWFWSRSKRYGKT
jgi:preprotein translocase subunit SecF